VALLVAVPLLSCAAAEAKTHHPLRGHHVVTIRRGHPVTLRFRVRRRFGRAILEARAAGSGLVIVAARGKRGTRRGRVRHHRLTIDVTPLVKHTTRLRLHTRGRVRLRAIRLVTTARHRARPPRPPAPAPPPPGPSPGPSNPCGVQATAAPVQHVVWIVFENHDYSQIIGNPDAPTFNAAAHACGLATNFTAEAHPSLPNYIAMTSGSTQGITDDRGPSSHPLNVANIFQQLGPGWRALEEGMPSNCARSDSGNYAVRHNPAVYYTNLGAACQAQDVPLADPPDISARFTFVTPSLCDDMHSNSCPGNNDEIKQGDDWLAQWLPKFESRPEYAAGHTVIFITFDENSYSGVNHVATIVIGPSTPRGYQNAGAFTHYSMLLTTEQLLGLPPIGQAATAASMAAFCP
jgi:hypothetical protein